jgi:hypothetical protein
MTRDEAIKHALQFIQSNALDVGPITDVRFFDAKELLDRKHECPPDVLETFASVTKNFRNQWVVTFRLVDTPGQVSCPGSRSIGVLETGETTLIG